MPPDSPTGNHHPKLRSQQSKSQPSDTLSDGGVLLETANWGQGYPYNTQCPIIDGVQAPTGCVATAMAIVMKYHNWPAQGQNIWDFNNVSTDFSKSSYDFSSYSLSYEDNVESNPSINNLAKLFKDLGTSINMYYQQNGSAAQPHDIGHVMTRFFKYSPDCRNLIKRDYEDNDWNEIILNELNSNRPVIYSAASKVEGHCFVIDGYKSEMYHINWGWDGRLNGYFALSALNPYNADGSSYDFDHSMIAGIEPDFDSNSFSEVWIDTGSDRGEPWQTKWEQDSHMGKGMCIDCSEITSGEPFNLLTETLHAPVSFGGEVAIAMMNRNNQIVDIIKSIHIEDNSESPTIGSFPYIYLLEAHQWKNLVYNGNIEPGMYIQLVARRDGANDWEIVNGTPETPNKLPVTGNEPTVLKEIITYHGVPSDNDVVSYNTEIARVGQPHYTYFKCSFGIAHLFINNLYYGSFDDFRSKSAQNVEPITTRIRYVDIYYTPQNSLLSKIVDNVKPGTLANRLDNNDLMNLYRLKITGIISTEDINFLNNLNSLGELDLSEASIVVNEDDLSLPVLPFLRVLSLPKTLSKVSFRYQGISIISVPESLKDCENLLARDFMVFESKTPPSANYEAIKRYTESNFKVPAILIVPKGSRGAYQQHPYWRHFTDIIEMDENDSFNASYKVEGDFMYCSVTNNINALTDQYRHQYKGDMILPVENFRFPYRMVAFPSEINGDKLSILKNDVCPNSTFEMFNGRDFHYIPDEGFITAYNYVFIGYIISPRLTPNFVGMSAYAFVPAYSTIGLSTSTDEFNNTIYERYEMFAMNCNKESNNVSIAPKLEGINIEEVEINGKVVEPSGSRYAADFTQDISIIVRYNFNGQIKMSTEYTPEFIAKLPHNPEDASGIVTLLNDIDLPIEIYNLSGHQIFSGHHSDIPKLQNGIYIIKQGANTKKIIRAIQKIAN